MVLRYLLLFVGGCREVKSRVSDEDDVCRITWECDEEMMKGVACKLDSKGFHALCRATEEVVGVVKPYSITGSLPLIKDLQV